MKIKLRPNYTKVEIIKNGIDYSICISRHFIGTQTLEGERVEEFEAEASFHCSYDVLGDKELRRIVEEAAKSGESVDLNMVGLEPEEETIITIGLKSQGLEVEVVKP